MGVEQGCRSLSLLPTLSLATCHGLSCRSPLLHVLRWRKPLPTSHLLWYTLHFPCSTQGFGAGTMLPVPLYKQTAAFNFPFHVLFSLRSHTIQGFSFKKDTPLHCPPLHAHIPPSILSKCQIPHGSVSLLSPALAPSWGFLFWGSWCDLSLDTSTFLLLEKEHLSY